MKDLTNKIIMGIPVDSLKFAMGAFRGVPEPSDRERAELSAAESEARKAHVKVDELKGCVDEVAEILRKTLEGVHAIEFGVDKTIGTDRTVFCVHGPNMGDYGKAEVAVVFKDAISRHPDAFLTPVAAMGYYQGWYIKNSTVGTDRPWAGKAKVWNDGGQKDYHSNIYQVGSRQFSEACAMEWICRVVQNGRSGAGDAREPSSVTLKDVQDLWYKSDPHAAIEGHLPGFVPLECVERVYIKDSVEDAGRVCKELSSAGISCELVPDTKKAVWDMMATPKGASASASASADDEGYSFFVGGDCRECTIPVDLVGAEAGAVMFSTLNGGATGDLMVTLSDKAFGSSDRHCVTFKIPPFDDSVYAYNEEPASICGDESIEHVKSAGFGDPKSETHYAISFEKDRVVLSRLSNKLIEMELQKQMQRFISFSAEVYPMVVKNVRINKKQ